MYDLCNYDALIIEWVLAIVMHLYTIYVNFFGTIRIHQFLYTLHEFMNEAAKCTIMVMLYLPCPL